MSLCKDRSVAHVEMCNVEKNIGARWKGKQVPRKDVNECKDYGVSKLGADVTSVSVRVVSLRHTT